MDTSPPMARWQSGCDRRGGGHGAGRAAGGRRAMTGGRGGVGSTCRGDGHRSGCSTRRGGCPAVSAGCGVERVSWAVGNSAFTAPLEELTAYLAQVTDRTTVSRVLGISWPAVGSIVERVVTRQLNPGRLAGLRRIGIDEFSYRKRHHYLTVVVDHDTRRVVWAGKGRSAETLDGFFNLLGPSGCEGIALVTVDLAASWQKALRARVPHARGGLRPVSR